MNVGIGTQAAQILFWEYINWIFYTVQLPGIRWQIVAACMRLHQVVSVTQLDRLLCRKDITLGSPVYLHVLYCA
jgi:hypothetical protein